jgi:hypothetical protein
MGHCDNRLPTVPRGLQFNAVIRSLSASEMEAVYWHLSRFLGGPNKDLFTALFISARQLKVGVQSQ